MKKLILAMLGLTLLVSSCSKEAGKTQASLKLSLGGITNMATGLGSGGTLLFGRSANGEQFGKVVAGAEENLIIPNGDWTFYAFMWEQNQAGKMMSGNVRCSKILSKLSGTDVVLNFNLTNANCSDPEFSNGRTYNDVSNGFIRFADVFVDECDDAADPQKPWHCGIDNQGSALSYRLKFQSFKRGPDGIPLLSQEMLMGPCKKANKIASTELFQKGLEVNFPSGNGGTPFLVSVEMFLGNDTCTPDAKGSHHVMMNKGLGEKANLLSNVFVSNTKCTSPVLPASTPAESAILRKNRCEAYLGMVNINDCNNIPDSTLKFIPNVAVECSASSPSTFAIKHMVSIPKNRLCDQYLNVSSQQGAHPFAGGNGSMERPFKICNEWQINQIGEFDSDLSYSNKIYKLMNDLDMNKTDMGPYAKPKCVGFTGGHLERHHNFNPLDKINHGSCATIRTSENNGFQGLFIGNNKTIKNARISAEDVNQLGFVREFYPGTQIKNLNFKNLEVRGKYNIGGIAGYAGAGLISNIKIDGLDVEAKSGSNPGDGDKVGSIAGHSSAALEKISVVNAEVYGKSNVGGLVGYNDGSITQSGFSGYIDHNDSSGNYVGGLAGYMNGGSIQLSFSEGILESSSSYTGGLIGKLNSGNLDSVYSTMSIASRNGSGPFLGGIAGYLNSGSIANAYFDGSIKHLGGGSTPTIFGISSTGVSNCYSSFGSPGANCNAKTYAEFRNGALSFSGTLASNWIKTNGSVPRFAWEQRECALPQNQASIDGVGGQIASGRGGITAPIVICNATQFKNVDGRDAALNYRIADDINLSSWTSSAHLILEFKGTMNGDNHNLYGSNVTFPTNPPMNHIGLINVNSGKIKNVTLVNNIMNSYPSKDATGLLVGKNQGIIEDIELYSNELNAFYRAGLVAGRNDSLGPDSGIIQKIDAQNNSIKGYNKVGGAVGLNTAGAKLSQVFIDAIIEDEATIAGYTLFGGIVGQNQGVIDQAQFSGEIKFSNPTSATEVYLGGVTGLNEGSISNTLVDNYSRITAKNYSYVGGLVGKNATGASVTKSINLGRVISSVPITGTQPFNATIGSDLGVMVDTFYLQNNTAYFVTQSQATSCSGTFVTMPSSPPFDTGATFDLLSKDIYSNSGNTLQSLSLASVPGTAGDVTYDGDCNPNDYFSFYKKYEDIQDGVKTAGDFNDIDTFDAFDIAFESGDPATEKNVNRLIEFYVAKMENRAPNIAPPIWELDDHDGYPRLLQVDR